MPLQRITVAAVGRLREGFARDGAALFARRLSRYTRLSVVEVKEEPYRGQPSPAVRLEILEREGERLARAVPPGSGEVGPDAAWVALEPAGRMLSSEGLAAWMQQAANRGKSHVAFFIGGSLGLAEGLTGRCELRLSLSPLTFPHELARLILLEQIYRAFTILRGEPYHK